MIVNYQRFIVFACALLLAAACSGSEEKPCAPGDCGGGRLCLDGVCVDSDGDVDRDGLASGREFAAGTDPLAPDSDSDGIADGAEWGVDSAGQYLATPLDFDGDGVPDVLESAVFDSDGDCVPDQWDPEPGGDSPLAVLMKPLVCPAKGVCLGAWEGMSVQCLLGVPVCVSPEVPGYQFVETWCDGVDNDCDGVVDEGATYGGAGLGEVCLVQGECGEGVVECEAVTRSTVCSSGPGGSNNMAVPETCDGLDNNCNGKVDDGLEFNGLPLGFDCDAPGVCSQGVVECHPTLATVICSTMSGGSDDESSPEQCDGKDNDCDGDVDENLFMSETGACPHSGVCGEFKNKLSMVCNQGQWVCDASAIESYNDGDEYLCDGLDNDCDGQTDEDFQLVDLDGAKRSMGAACGVGVCAGGVVVCAADEHQVSCSSWDKQESEVCDGLDNDCDGVEDNGQQYNGKNISESCKGIGVCGLGVVECGISGGKATCSTNGDGSLSEATIEQCDLLDNDCDGQTDEQIAQKVPCNLEGVCKDAPAFAVCALGEWVCDFGYLPDWEEVEEGCDQKDNDCDGSVDEGAEKKFGEVVTRLTPAVLPGRADYAWTGMEETGSVYLSGGLAHPFPWKAEPLCLSDLWRVDTETGDWEKLTSMPSPRSMHSMTRIPGKKGLLVMGGQCGGGVVTGGSRYDAALDTWEPLVLGDEMTDRWGHAVFVSPGSGEAFVVGGVDAQGPVPSFRFGPEPADHGPLEQAPDVSFAAHCSASLSEDAWLFGGDDEQGVLSDTLYHLDLAGGTFTPVKGPGPAPRRLGSLLCLKDSLVLAGGEGVDGQLLSDVWRFDLDEQEWQLADDGFAMLAAPLLAPTGDTFRIFGGVRDDGSWFADAFVLGESGLELELRKTPGALAGAMGALDKPQKRFCVLGGFYTGAGMARPNLDLWCLNLAGNEWTRLDVTLPGPAAFGTLSYDPNMNRLLLVGGGKFEMGQQPQPLTPVCRFDALDLLDNQFDAFSGCEAESPGPGALSSHAAGVRWKNLTLWLYGGIDSAGLSNTLWRYGLDTGQWTQVEVLETGTGIPLPVRYGHALWIREESGQIIVAGGTAGAELPGAMLLIDPAQGSWRQLVSLPWLQSAFPALFYDDPSDDGLLVQGDQSTGTHFVLSGTKLHSIEVLDFSIPVVPLSMSAQIYDPWRRAGLRFGGLTGQGLSTGVWHRFSMDCY